METTKNNFKLQKFNFELDLLADQNLDNAQYLMLLLLERFKISKKVFVSDEAVKEKESENEIPIKAILAKFFVDGKGILIGTMSTAYGVFEYYLNGIPNIHDPEGNQIIDSKLLKTYLNGEKDISTLHYDTKSYILPINTNAEDKYYGVFYSLSDAIKITSENDLVKTEEITS